MKLYTEEQMRKALWLIEHPFADGKRVNEVIESLTPIELPSDEEIGTNAYAWCQVPDERGYINSGDDYHVHELPAFIAGAKWVIEQIKQQANGK